MDNTQWVLWRSNKVPLEAYAFTSWSNAQSIIVNLYKYKFQKKSTHYDLDIEKEIERWSV